MHVRLKIRQPEPLILRHRQEDVIDALKRGEVDLIRYDQKWPADELVRFALDEGFLQEGLKSFPDPRVNWEVPIEVMLLAHVMQRLNDEHSLLLAPYMINSADLITRLGYNAKVLEEGFNDRAKSPREAAFHGETMKHLLAHLGPAALLRWFNEKWCPLWKKHSPGKTGQYVLDGTEIEIPEKHVRFYKGAGTRRNSDDTYSHGYKIVWIYEIIDNKGVVVALDIAPIQVHDIELARPLVARTNLEAGSTLIMDRGFIDSTWITHLKEDRGIDTVIPLRKNMDVTVASVTWADNHRKWQPHPNPTRAEAGQLMAEIALPELFWRECPVLKGAALVRWTNKKTEELENVLFVTTKGNTDAPRILDIYDQRPEIEEMHRQVKLFQSIETQPSKKLTHVVFRILIAVIGYNLMNLFLNSEDCRDYDEFSLKTLRQKRGSDPNPNVIIYTESAFAILRNSAFMPLVLRLPDVIREKIACLFEQASPRRRHKKSA
jgi:hypothetical protein